MLTDEEAMELMAEDIDIPIKHESKPYLMIPFPDGITNGDMIKSLFPDGTFIDKEYVYWYGINKQFHEFSPSWWNAPYEKGKNSNTIRSNGNITTKEGEIDCK